MTSAASVTGASPSGVRNPMQPDTRTRDDSRIDLVSILRCNPSGILPDIEERASLVLVGSGRLVPAPFGLSEPPFWRAKAGALDPTSLPGGGHAFVILILIVVALPIVIVVPSAECARVDARYACSQADETPAPSRGHQKIRGRIRHFDFSDRVAWRLLSVLTYRLSRDTR